MTKHNLAPRPPAVFRGKVIRGFGPPEYQAYIARRDAWVLQQMGEGKTSSELAEMLALRGHPVSHTTLDKMRVEKIGPKRGASKTPTIAKVDKSEIGMVANLIHELVERQLAPVREELLRLRGIEKKYRALKAAFVEDDA